MKKLHAKDLSKTAAPPGTGKPVGPEDYARIIGKLDSYAKNGDGTDCR